ncbi:hypothetical protein D3C75_1110720 [compost metagenome]
MSLVLFDVQAKKLQTVFMHLQFFQRREDRFINQRHDSFSAKTKRRDAQNRIFVAAKRHDGLGKIQRLGQRWCRHGISAQSLERALKQVCMRHLVVIINTHFLLHILH